MSEPWVKVGPCVPGSCQLPAIRCMRHAALYAQHTMIKQGWVCIDEYGTESAKAVDGTFLDILHAVQIAGVTLQRWMCGWDEARGTVKLGVWAPKAVAAIVGTIAGKVSPAEMASALKEAKTNAAFAGAVDASWRMGGAAAALEIIAAELPHLAQAINKTVQGGST